MALGAKVVVTAKDVGAAPDDQIFDADFEVKGYLMFATRHNAFGAFAADQIIAIGGSDGTRNRGVATYSEDGVGVSNTARRQANKVLTIFDGAGAIVAECVHKNFTGGGAGGNGVTVTWDVNDAFAGKIMILMLGDDDISDLYVDRFQAQLGLGTYDITAPGFEPDLLIWWLSQNGNTSPAPAPPNTQTNAAHLTFGFKSKMSLMQNLSTASEDAQGTSDTDRIFRQTITALSYKAGLSTPDGSADFDSWLVNGFRLDQIATASVGYNVDYMAIKGNLLALVSGALTPVAGAPQTQALTGLGGQAKAILIASRADTGTVAVESSLSIGAGYDDGGAKPFTQGCMWAGDKDNVGTMEADQRMNDTELIELCLPNAPPTVQSAADLESWDADGLTLNWTVLDGSARAVRFLMLGDGPVGGRARGYPQVIG